MAATPNVAAVSFNIRLPYGRFTRENPPLFLRQNRTNVVESGDCQTELAADSDRMQNQKNQPPLPGIGATIASGFDLTTKHWWLLLLPVLLDTLFWIGPRLSVRPIIEQTISMLGPSFPLAESLMELAPQINLFAYLGLPVIGVPTLMGGLAPLETPLQPFVWNVDSMLVWFLLFVGLLFAGLILTTIYFSLIAAAVRHQPGGVGAFIHQLLVSLLRLFLLSMVFIAVMLVIGLPLLPVLLALAYIGGEVLANIVLLTAFTLAAVYLAFSLHGIFLNDRPTGRALVESVRLVRRHLNSTVALFLWVFVTRTLLRALWLLADNGSWLTLVSILGHSFVSTALVVATFIFYRDRHALEFTAQPAL
jgi:hypothetical protein